MVLSSAACPAVPLRPRQQACSRR